MIRRVWPLFFLVSFFFPASPAAADEAMPVASTIGEEVVTLNRPGYFTAQISTIHGAIRSFRLLDAQFFQKAREAPAGLVVPPAEKLAEGPLDLVSTWDPSYYPFAIDFQEFRDDPTVVRKLKADPAHPAREDRFWTLFVADPVFTIVRRTDDAVTMVWPDPSADRSTLFIERTWRLGENYTLEGSIRLINVGPGPVSWKQRLAIRAWEPPTAKAGMCGGMFSAPVDNLSAVCYDAESLHSTARADLPVPPAETALGKGGRAQFTGIASRYFLLAAVPRGDIGALCLGTGTSTGAIAAILSWFPERGDAFLLRAAGESCVPDYLAGSPGLSGRMSCAEAERILGLSGKWDATARTEAHGRALAAARDEDTKARVNAAETALRTRQSREFLFTAFLGPKDIDELKSVHANLDDTIDFWIVGFLAKPMLWLLRGSYAIIPNWCVAILILTLVVKLLTLYWSQKSILSMRRMQQLKPKLDELRERYKDDKTKLNQETMALYKREKVNPLGGCLPMLLQMPIWIALYRTIYGAVDLYHAPLFLWIDDMSAHDPYFVMPILLGVLTFVQQKMTPQTGDQAQARMMLFLMPIMFTAFMLFLPSGLVFYILLNTVLSIGHQVYLNRRLGTVPVRAAKK